MALTQEQIESLKPGDTLIIHGEFRNTDFSGDLVIKTWFTYGDQNHVDFNAYSPSCVSLPPGIVTPVEELKPYIVRESDMYWKIYDENDELVVAFKKNIHPNAKAAAEAERDRMNKEWQTKVCSSDEGKEEGNG